MQPLNQSDDPSQTKSPQSAESTGNPSVDTLQVEYDQFRPGTTIDPGVRAQQFGQPQAGMPNTQSQSRPPFERPSRSANTEDDDYAAASYSAASYAKEIRAKRPSSKHNWRWLFAILIILIVAAGAYWFMNRPKTKAPASASTQNTKSQSQASKPLISATTKTYNSNQFAGVSFNYPADWKVTETDGSGVLTAVSPAVNLKTASGQTEPVALVYKIRAKQQTLPELSKGSAIAVLESQKISYANPSQSQRAQTYISFLQYAGTTTVTGLDGIYITGDNGYQAQQAAPQTDFASLDPLISVTFVKCAAGSTSCVPTSPAVTLATGDWNNPQLSNPIEKMLESLIAQ
ncbi:MAG TPA: hypothetical protein VLG16_01360 [Candidatus Saccharimonadales bacterium]|nr:hypothetical protein [Candidatus Saccharimonadales bacterium]